MAGDWSQSPPGTGGSAPSGLDTSVPHIARVYDYWLGGKDNFAVDREAAEQVMAAYPRDFREAVAVMLTSVLRLIPDEDDAYAIVPRLMEAVPSGSWLALSHPARDVHPQQVTEAASRFNQLAPAKATLRPRDEILRFFDGLELLETGLVQVPQWRPGLAAPGHNQESAGYCGLARKA